MNYRLIFRKITSQDIDASCPFLPSDEEYDVHFDAIFEDIETINGVTSVSLLADGSVRVATVDMAMETLKKQLEPFLSQHFPFLRLASCDGIK